MPSATLQARTMAPVKVPTAQEMSDPNRAESWYESLPPAARAGLAERLTLIVRSMPPVAQLALRRYVVKTGHQPPISIGVDGLGHYHTVEVCGSKYVTGPQIDGLGQWGAIISGVIGAAAQTGTQVYLAHEQKDLQKDLQSASLANDRQIQEALAAANKETQLAMIAAQTEAAQIAGAASVGRAQQYAPVLASSMKWVGIAVAAVALVGGGIYFTRRKKK